MPRYAIIEASNSGLVWYITDAETPLAACQKADDDIGRDGEIEYEEYPPTSHIARISGYNGPMVYAVYEVPSAFEAEANDWRLVEQHPLVAYVTCQHRIDD